MNTDSAVSLEDQNKAANNSAAQQQFKELQEQMQEDPYKVPQQESLSGNASQANPQSMEQLGSAAL